MKRGAWFFLIAFSSWEMCGAAAVASSNGVSSETSAAGEILVLREELSRQQAEIDALRRSLEEQRKLIEGLIAGAPVPALARPSQELPAYAPAPRLSAEQSEKPPEPPGLRLSGDFRFRTDLISREGNLAAPPVRNFRERYRLRLNVEKELNSKLFFRLQLATGAINNGITFDQDMAATVAHHPLFISEAYVARSASLHSHRAELDSGVRRRRVLAVPYCSFTGAVTEAPVIGAKRRTPLRPSVPSR